MDWILIIQCICIGVIIFALSSVLIKTLSYIADIIINKKGAISILPEAIIIAIASGFLYYLSF